MNQIKYIYLLIGVIVGLLFSQLKSFNEVIYLLDISQFLLYISALLYFISFTLIEILIFNNKPISTLQILEIKTNKNMRCLNITMVNNNLLEGQDLFKGIYTTLMNSKEFLNFGNQKIIILSVVLLSETEHNLHSNVLINNDTTFEEYYSTISHELVKYNNLQYGYHNEAISRYVMLAWNVDNAKNLLIKQTYTTNKLIRNNTPSLALACIGRSYSTLNSGAKKWFNKSYINI
jgi:hypothetical protein